VLNPLKGRLSIDVDDAISPGSLSGLRFGGLPATVAFFDPRDPRVTAPKVVSKIEPAFPQEMRAAREPIDALVIVEAIIDEHGTVTDVCPLKGDPRLVQVTIAALRQWKFTPGMIDGRPSAFRFASTTNYKLR